MKTILVDAVFTFVSETGEIFMKMQELLDTYSNRKIIVTNAAYEKYEDYGLNKVPYEVFTLEHQPDKPVPTYFQKLMGHFNLRPEELVYFEHNPEAVKSAESVGIASYHYDENKKDLNALKEFLDKNV